MGAQTSRGAVQTMTEPENTGIAMRRCGVAGAEVWGGAPGRWFFQSPSTGRFLTSAACNKITGSLNFPMGIYLL